MRTIKFRVYDLKEKEMVSPKDLLTEYNNRYLNESLISDDTFTFMQFTGMFDSEGTEIYEGDTISDHVGTGTVKYVDEDAAFRVSYGDGTAKWFIDYILKGERESIIVIGNIYENKTGDKS